MRAKSARLGTKLSQINWLLCPLAGGRTRAGATPALLTCSTPCPALQEDWLPKAAAAISERIGRYAANEVKVGAGQGGCLPACLPPLLPACGRSSLPAAVPVDWLGPTVAPLPRCASTLHLALPLPLLQPTLPCSST